MNLALSFQLEKKKKRKKNVNWKWLHRFSLQPRETGTLQMVIHVFFLNTGGIQRSPQDCENSPAVSEGLNCAGQSTTLSEFPLAVCSLLVSIPPWLRQACTDAVLTRAQALHGAGDAAGWPAPGSPWGWCQPARRSSAVCWVQPNLACGWRPGAASCPRPCEGSRYVQGSSR